MGWSGHKERKTTRARGPTVRRVLTTDKNLRYQQDLASLSGCCVTAPTIASVGQRSHLQDEE